MLTLTDCWTLLFSISLSCKDKLGKTCKALKLWLTQSQFSVNDDGSRYGTFSCYSPTCQGELVHPPCSHSMMIVPLVVFFTLYCHCLDSVLCVGL